MKKFFIEIITPEKSFFSGEADELVIMTVDGLVSIMAGHQPNVFTVEPGTIKILNNDEWKEAFISEGFVEVRPDETIVLAQAVEWPEDIDESKAIEAKERAEEMIRRAKSNQEYNLSKMALKRAFARLQVKSRGRKI